MINIKILFNITSLEKGGAERVVSNLCNYFVKNNNVYLLANSLKNQSYYINDDVKLYELDLKTKMNFIYKQIRRINKTLEICKKIKPDIIISFLPIPSFRVLFIKKYLNCKVIVCDRNDPTQEYKALSYILMKILYKKADGFIFQTSEQQKYFNKKIQEKSVIIPNPLNEKFLKKYDKIRKEKTIINVGRLHPQKNQKMLINSFSKILSKHPEYVLKIYGIGELKDSLIKQIELLNLKEKVFLCDVCDDIVFQLLKSELFVLSSNYEGMPNSLIEAMACGLPCISTDCPCGGPRDLITNNTNGILIPIDEDLLANSIDYILSNPKVKEKIGKKAEMIKKRCAPDVINKQWMNYIQKVVNSSF